MQVNISHSVFIRNNGESTRMKHDSEANLTWSDLFDTPVFDDPIELRMLVIAILALIFIVGFVGNLCSSIVILKHRSLHTVINLYLLNLAISDTILLFCIFFTISYLWDPYIYLFGEVGCKIYSFIIYFLYGNGILTVTALAIERYFAICHPLVLRKRGKSRVASNVICILIISFVCSTLDVMNLSLQLSHSREICVMIPTESARITNAVLAIVMYFIPLSIITTMYTMILVKLNTKDNSGDKTFNGRSLKKRATWTLVALTAFIFFCWTPLISARLLLALNYYTKKEYRPFLRVVFYLWCVNSWLGTAMNPIFFSIMSKKFRTAFKALLQRRRMIHTSTCRRSSNNK